MLLDKLHLLDCSLANKMNLTQIDQEKPLVTFTLIISDVNPMTEVVGRVNDIYSAVVQSEECMERIACEVGGLAADVGLTQSPAIK